LEVTGTLGVAAITSTGQFNLTPTSGSSWLYLTQGTSSNTAYISWLNPSGNRIGYLGSSATNISLALENSANFVVTGGNVGIGITPYAWNSIFIGIDFVNKGGVNSYTNYLALSQNMYYGTGALDGWRYKSTGYAAAINLESSSGNIVLRNTSTSGTADAALSWQDRMTITSTGAATFSSSVNVNGLATSANYKLGVTGAAFISGTNNKGVFITDGASYSSMVGLNSDIAAYNDMEIRASGTDYQLYLTTSGKVGIGTNNPTGNLTVKTATNFNFRVDNYLSATNIASVNDAASAYAMFNIDGNVVRIQGLNTGGNVCIGTTTDFGYKLNLNGQPGCNGYTAWTNWSDSRLKENVTDFDANNVLDKISKIRPVTYNYNELSGFDEATRSRRISGFIAQELMEVFPDMVSTMKRDDGGEYYDTNLSNLDLYLVKAIQELYKKLQRNNIN
jgi:hypothetical protein